jgi:hypothetical protein
MPTPRAEIKVKIPFNELYDYNTCEGNKTENY